jgi:CRISPR/Cas system-associated exonuclease Cas4 (RecB family)
MESFLEQTAREIISQIEWSRLSRTTLVLPSHRAGVVLKDALLRLQKESHAPAVWAPQVRTLTQLQDELSPLYAEDELFTIIRLYRHYRALMHDAEAMPLDVFYNWGRQMLADFTNVDASMGASEVPNFFENTIAAHELERWKLDEEVEERLRALMGTRTDAAADSVRAAYERLWDHLYELYKALRAEMLEEQKGYAGLRQRAVIERWEEESVQNQIKERTYIFVGFNYLLPVERELMTLLKDKGQALFFWDYVPHFQTNRKAFAFAEKNAGMLDRSADRVQTASRCDPDRCADRFPKEVTVLSCVSREAQAQYVHRWLQENYTAKGQKVGVVICDESMLEPVIYALPAITLPGEKQPEPVNITKGFPLRNTAIYARALAWLNEETKGRAEELAQPETIDRLIEALFVKDESQEPRDESQEQALHWQELLALEADYQIRKILNQLRLLVTGGLDGVPFTMKLLRLLFRRMVESVTMPFHGEPVTDIQIMGVLETRMMDFDRLLLLNVEEGVLPQRQADISFIPYYLRKTYHMQTSDERATVYAYNFFRLLSRADQATLLFSSAETAEGGRGMSRFLMQLLVSPEFIVQKYHLQEHAQLDLSPLMDDAHSYQSLSSLLQQDGDGVWRRADGRVYRLSPSALNTYISCPRSFYLQYVLQMRPQEKEDVLFEPSTLGSFVHYAMKYIYRTYFKCSGFAPKTILADDIEALRGDRNRLQEALMDAYDQMNRRWQLDHPMDEQTHYLPELHTNENVIILGYIDNILQRDAADAQEGLQMCELEKEHAFMLPLGDGGTIEVGGNIDRLDIVGRGETQRLRVVDYKSGSYTDTTHDRKMSAGWDELFADKDKGYVRQTLLYSHAVAVHDKTQLPIEPNLFFCRRRLTEIDTMISVNSLPVSDYRTLSEPFLAALRSKAAELLKTTSFPQCAEDDCPSFCPFFSLCGRQPKSF